MMATKTSGGRSEISFGFSLGLAATSGEGHTEAFSSGVWCASVVVVAVVIPPLARVSALGVTSELILARVLGLGRARRCFFGSSQKTSVTSFDTENLIEEKHDTTVLT